MTTIVSCKGISKTYQQGKVTVNALTNVDLSVETGGFMALAGPSGSGKTTLLNLIGGLDNPDSGTIQVDGQTYTHLNGSQMADLRLHRIGFIFQAYNLIPVLSAVENVEYVMLLQGVAAEERRQRAREVLDTVGLSGKYDRRPAELSGGQQQRVAVARSLANDPAIILADEPTGNLDLSTGEEIIALLKRLSEETGVTIISATHDFKMLNVSDQVIWIRDGLVEKIENREDLSISVGGIGGREAVH